MGISEIYKGKYEVGVEYVSGLDKHASNSYFDMKTKGFSFNLGYSIRDYSMINIALIGEYKRLNLKSDFLDEYKIRTSGNMFSTGVKLYKSIIQNDNYELIPFVSYNFGDYEIKMESADPAINSFLSVHENGKSNFTHIGLGIKFDKFFIEPTIVFNENISNFHIKFGMIINKKTSTAK